MQSRVTRKPCLAILSCAVPGILLSDFFPCSLPLAFLAAFCFTVAALFSRRLFPFCLLVLTLFLIRHDLDWRRSPGRFPIDLLSQGISTIRVTGVVTSDPLPAGYIRHQSHSRFEMRVTRVTFAGSSFKTRFPAQVHWTGPAPEWGDRIALAADIAPIALPRNPGEFSPSAYLARKGIFAELTSNYPEDCRVLAHGKGNSLLAWSRTCRAFLQRRLIAGIDDDPEIAGLVQTITLGLKKETSARDRELFQQVGALHLFVVNGLHVAMLACILGFLFKPFGIRRRLFALVIIPILFAYALLTGLNPGSVRAAIMAAVLFGASFVERRPYSLNTLAAAALILLLWDTNDLFQEGFRFSFAVVTAIILLAGVIQRPILSIGLPDSYLPRSLWTAWQRIRSACWRRIAELAAVSVAASIGSLPLSAGYFNLLTPSGFLANLLLVPLALLILAESLFSLLTTLAGSLPLAFNNVNWLLASTMLAFVHFFAWLPGGHFFISTSPSLPECRVTVLDLQPGQAVVIQSRGCVWLVDCGNHASYIRTVHPFLQSRGVNRLDGLILTHGAAASIGAFQEVVDDFAPRQIFESALTDRSPARRALHTAGRPSITLKSGDQFGLSSTVACKVLFPPVPFKTGKAADKSLVLRIDNGQSRILLMSESGFTGEHWLLDHKPDFKSSVVVIGGQSADLAGTDEFIFAAHPGAIVRGAPGYGFSPGDDRRWAANLRNKNITPYLQSDTGAVTIELSQSGPTVAGFLTTNRNE